MVIKKLLIIVVLMAVSTTWVYGGGGRIRIAPQKTEIVVGEQILVDAWISQDGTALGQSERPSEFEHVEFRIDTPRPGDVCVTTIGTSNSAGYVQGSCTATSPGTISVYVHSLDKGDDSSRYLLHFTSKSSSQEATINNSIPRITSIPTNFKTPTPMRAASSVTPVITQKTENMSSQNGFNLFAILFAGLKRIFGFN